MTPSRMVELATGYRNQSPLLSTYAERYGDLAFDLIASVLWSKKAAVPVIHRIFSQLRAETQKIQSPPESYERAWILKRITQEVLRIEKTAGRSLTPPEQLMLDSLAEDDDRLRHFDGFFHRLDAKDQILLILRDKYGLPYSEIAMALEEPVGSLSVRRQQALRALESWIYQAEASS